MRFFYTLIGSFVFSSALHAVTLPDSLKNLSMSPFFYGVASGDPLQDRVILWTHVTSLQSGNIQVSWKVATDTSFANVVSNGVANTDATKDYTVKVDAAGLQPNTWYYYRFTYDGKNSITGRTRTMPAGNTQQLRIALLTCADYKDGFFNAYEKIAAKNGVDAVIHHGDYIYETSSNSNERKVYPNQRCKTVDDYRSRYAFYRSDAQLLAAHQQYPWFCIWDDHETRNDSWRDGAQNETGAAWQTLRDNGLQVYHEWMPVRFPDENNPLKIYRNISLGNIAELIMLDARIIARDTPVGLSDPMLLDTNRTILGATQLQWLKDKLDSSTAKWKIVTQQVIFAPFLLGGVPAPGSEKAWNGFPAERKKVLQYISDRNIKNVVITTGDLHAAVASDLALDVSQYDSTTGSGSVAVEFVTPSLTSGGSFPIDFQIFKSENHFLSFGDVTKRGYSVLDIRPDTVFCNYFFTPYLTLSQDETFAGCRYTSNENPHLRNCGGEAKQQIANPALAPAAPVTATSISEIELSTLRIYPNPAGDFINVSIDAKDAYQLTTIEVYSPQGKKLLKQEIQAGKTISKVDISSLAKGTYFFKAKQNGVATTIGFIKQ